MDQFMGLVRQLAPFISGILVTFGVISATQQADATAIILGGAGLVTQAIAFYLSWKANSKASILTSAAQMPEVKEVVLEKPTMAAAAGTTPQAIMQLAETTPANVR